jgi:DNA repair protein RecO (recombination protein O)
MSYHHYRTTGIVLLQKDSGESDQLFTLYTADFGKIELLGKAIRKITSKLRSCINLFYLSEIEFVQGKNQKILTDAFLLEKFSALRKNLYALRLFYRFAQIIDALTPYEETDKKMWTLIQNTIRKFQQISLESTGWTKKEQEKIKADLVFYYFLWNFFALLGYFPELYVCAQCAKKLLPQTLFFSPPQGGVICWQCFSLCKKEMALKKQSADNHFLLSSNTEPQEMGKEIFVETIKLLRIFLSQPVEKIQRLTVNKKELENMEQISTFYFSFLKELYGYRDFS